MTPVPGGATTDGPMVKALRERTRVEAGRAHSQCRRIERPADDRGRGRARGGWRQKITGRKRHLLVETLGC
jgi:hypothetical protein